MDRELDVAAAASAGGWLRWRKRHVVAPGTPCANCAAALQGPYCHNCGQLAEDFHRSLPRLAMETVENLLELDGRIWRTLPRLVRRPARLTRDYLDGRRAFQIPPLRLFLVVVLLLFTVGSLTNHTKVIATDTPTAQVQAPKDVQVDLGKSKRATALSAWLKPRLKYSMTHQAEFKAAMDEWFHRLAILFLPISALILAGLFVFRRRFFIYDHLIFSMHSLSFQGLLFTAQTLVGAMPVVGSASGVLLLAAPVHLFVHMRGVYSSSVFGTLARMALLFLASSVALLLMLFVVIVVNLNGMVEHTAGGG